MNKKLILIFVVIIALANASSLGFNLGQVKYTKASDFWTVDVPIIGGSGNYQYNCELPTGWLVSNNQFKIPSSCSTNYNFEYVSRCRVLDLQIGNFIERALSFKCTTTGYIITDNDYFYGLTSYSSGSIGTVTGLDALKRLTTLASSFTGSFSFGNLNSYTGSYPGSLTGSLTGSSLLAGLPTMFDCDKLINDGNIVEIVALIQKVVSGTLRCDAKIAYLNDLLGRINAGLSIKKESIAQLQGLIDSITVQVQKLLAQITSLKSEKAALDLTNLKAQLDALMLKLKSAYNEYNTCTGSTKAYDDELKTLKIEQQGLEAKVYQLKCQIDELTVKFNQLNVDIAALEQKLTELKAQRDQISVQITSVTAEWKSKSERLEWVKNRCIWLINKINEINSSCASLKNVYLQLELDLKALQDKYNQACGRSDQIDQQIASIQVEIDRQNGLLSQYQVKIKSIQQCVGNLNGAIKEILQSINYVQYSCHDCNNVIIDDRDVEPCFRFGKNDWFNYVSKCYNVTIPQIQIQIPTITVDIKPITIYSPAFQQNYGSCFGDQVKVKGSQWDNQSGLGFDGDFSCSSGFESLSAKKGKIRGINNKFVDVDCDDGTQVRLKLGSCSKFEGQGNDFVPKVGHTIHWKGSKNSDSTFNLHSSTCY